LPGNGLKHPPFLLPHPEPEGFPQTRREFLRGLFPRNAQLRELCESVKPVFSCCCCFYEVSAVSQPDKKQEGVCYIDSTALSVCHTPSSYCISTRKAAKEFASRGKAGKGWFFGFKAHRVCSKEGDIHGRERA
jgi:hypothetical protein